MIVKQQDGRVLTVVIRWWNSYEYFVKRATLGTWVENDKIDFWRDRLFSKFVTYLLPICCIALIPGVLVSLLDGYPFLAGFDLFVVLSIALTVLNKNLYLGFRKVFLFLCFTAWQLC